ncbi:hypothetical protein GALMADRAFT_220270 [Galerina marginata CBS 339.88]|uniref:Uncharacterized protein n=1 Tax=Galerina marginata (strain CBS 339.88) TaxID=685588 RepID=A0A067TZT9_GALM3|nr:hypothetical protein GALMADRAFT_220270 [Galerina marginata CBS 339.88]
MDATTIDDSSTCSSASRLQNFMPDSAQFQTPSPAFIVTDTVLTICPGSSSMYGLARLYALHLAFDCWRILHLNLKPHFMPPLGMKKEQFFLAVVGVIRLRPLADAVIINPPSWLGFGPNVGPPSTSNVDPSTFNVQLHLPIDPHYHRSLGPPITFERTPLLQGLSPFDSATTVAYKTSTSTFNRHHRHRPPTTLHRPRLSNGRLSFKISGCWTIRLQIFKIECHRRLDHPRLWSRPS